MDADASLLGRPAVACDGHQTIEEVGGLLRQRQWIPAQLVRRGGCFVEAVVEGGVRYWLERLMHRRRADPVQPAAPIEVARRGERAARQLFGIQAVRHPLR